MSKMALVQEFPMARSGALMFVHNHQLLIWGGFTQVILGEGEDRFIVDIELPGREGLGVGGVKPPRLT